MKKHTLATGLIAAAVLGAGTFAWAEYQPSDPAVSAHTAQVADYGVAAGATTGTAGNGAAPGDQGPGGRHPGMRRFLRHRAEGFLGRAVHGSVIVKGEDGTWQTVDFDKGKLSRSGDSITVARPDGKTVTLTVTSDTKFRGIDSLANVRDGQPGLVVSKDGKATLVAQRGGNFPGRPGVGPDEGQVPAA